MSRITFFLLYLEPRASFSINFYIKVVHCIKYKVTPKSEANEARKALYVKVFPDEGAEGRRRWIRRKRRRRRRSSAIWSMTGQRPTNYKLFSVFYFVTFLKPFKKHNEGRRKTKDESQWEFRPSNIQHPTQYFTNSFPVLYNSPLGILMLHVLVLVLYSAKPEMLDARCE